MVIAMIAAMAKNRVIGLANRLPWRMPADMRHFKQTTMGKPIIMGRSTFESFGAKPLPGRRNIILTANAWYQAPPSCIVVHSCEEALKAAEPDEEVMVIGGESIYRLFLPLANRLYLTIIDADIQGDSYFPDYAGTGEWQETGRREFAADGDHPYAYRFLELERKPMNQ